MCSIVGVVSPSKIPAKLLRQASCLLDFTARRGPDDQGSVLIDNKVYLGSNRLCIIGCVPDGRMPMKSLNGDYWISYNGEIYNYKELRAQLIDKGFKFRSTTDTEVVLNAYICWGDKFVEKLNGIFAFLIYDKNNDLMISGRDRFGGRPLYYAKVDDCLVFSSDFKLLNDLAYPKRKVIDISALTAYLQCRFVPGNKTIIKDIFKLQPAEMISWRLSDLSPTVKRFWRPKLELHKFNQNEFNKKLAAAINLTKTADLTPDILLSGGLDSAAIAAIMNNQEDRNVQTYTFAFANPDPIKKNRKSSYQITTPNLDERDKAANIAKLFKYPNNSFVMDYDIGLKDFLDMMRILGEPIASTNALGNYLFAKALKGKTKLVLAGTGSDEFLGGYQDLYFNGARKSLRTAKNSSVFLKALSDFDGGAASPLAFLDPDLIQEGYLNDYLYSSMASFPKESYPNELLNQIAFFELAFALPGWELDQADRLFMSQSIELRPAFLENNFVDYGLTISSRDKAGKRPLRQAMHAYLPKKAIDQVKYPGMGTPKDICKQGWFKDLINELFEQPLDIWNKKSIVTLSKESYDDWNFDVLYRLVYLQLWLKDNNYKI